MRVILANPRGFCAGVNMAIDCVSRVLEIAPPPIYVYHEIVHNRHVVEDFSRRGVRFVEDLSEVPPGSILIYSAHGVAPAVRQEARQRRLLEVDATCPLVTKVHMEVLRFARQGCTVIFVGHRRHDEAIGTAGEAPNSIIIVENPEDVDRLDLPPDAQVAYVTQTTLSVTDAARTIAALKRRWPQIRSPHRGDICYATTNRQAAVSSLAAEVDLVLVIGSRNSSNSRRLAETALAGGTQAHLVDDAGQLDPQWLNGARSVLVTAGASAPEYLVEGLLDRLRKEFGGVVETRTLIEETVSFEPPPSLRELAGAAGCLRSARA